MLEETKWYKQHKVKQITIQAGNEWMGEQIVKDRHANRQIGKINKINVNKHKIRRNLFMITVCTNSLSSQFNWKELL